MKFRHGSAIHPAMDEDIVCSVWKHVDKRTKNRTYGTTGYVLCDYDPVNHRIYQKGLGDRIVYGWDHNGIEIPEDQACSLPEFQIQQSENESAPF